MLPVGGQRAQVTGHSQGREDTHKQPWARETSGLVSRPRLYFLQKKTRLFKGSQYSVICLTQFLWGEESEVVTTD